MARHIVRTFFILLSILAMSGCADSGGGDTQSIGKTELLLVGAVRQEVFIGTDVTLRAMVVKTSDDHNVQSAVVKDFPLHFEIVSPYQGELSASEVLTDDMGLTSVVFTGQEVGQYQIKVTGEGLDTKYFTVEVMDRRVGLEELQNDISTFVRRRITVGVKATSIIPGQQATPLAGAKITFSINNSGSNAQLEAPGTGQLTDEVEVLTNADGIASIFLFTGDTAGNAVIKVSMDGATDVGIRVTINANASGGSCETNSDCPPDAPICQEAPGGSGDKVCVELTDSCQTNDDCPGMYVCDTQSHTCTLPTDGKRCDPFNVAAQPCPDGQICKDGYCQDPNITCQNNDDCAAGQECVAGQCLYPGGGCQTSNDCPGGQVCLNGVCMDADSCYPAGHNPRRLGGTWNFDSMLHLDEAVGGFTGAILGASHVLRDIILGNWQIGGLPQWLVDALNALLQRLIQEYVPPWAQQAIIVLGDIDDILDDMRVYSTVNLVAMGNNEYYGAQHWDLVVFEYRGQMIQSPPEDIFSNTGNFEVEDFSSREICGMFYIDRFYVRNGIGGLFRWAVDAAVTGVTCTSDQSECYYSLEEMLTDIIDCDSVATSFDEMVHDMWPNAPSVYDAAFAACNNYKTDAINEIIDALDDIETKFKMMSLRGIADIQDDSHLNDGHWYGTFTGATGIFLGNYTGEFTAVKQ